MSLDTFSPTASVALLKKRAQLLHRLRAFFYGRSICEVDVPVLGQATVTDPYIEALTVAAGQSTQYLQTSPEFFMKRLLAAGMPSIYCLGKAFRQDEQGRRHRAEFTMLEWYCLGMDDHSLMDQLEDLLSAVAPSEAVKRIRYGDLFKGELGFCPYSATSAQLQQLAKSKLQFDGVLANKSAWLDLIFSHCIEPTLKHGFTLVYDYPAEQSALARLEQQGGVLVARRFELFGGGIELANGYWELICASEQRSRFEADLLLRKQLGLPEPNIDHRFMAALDYGLPACAGVALGVDRLLMVLTGSDDIAQVMPFAGG